MYIKRKRKKKKKKSHLPANLFFSTTYMQDDMNPSAVSFYICPCHIRIEIIDKRMGYNRYTVISFFLPFFVVYRRLISNCTMVNLIDIIIYGVNKIYLFSFFNYSKLYLKIKKYYNYKM